MKITVKLSAVCDMLYASTAMQALMAEKPGSFVHNILTPAQAPALRRIAADAHVAIIGRLGLEWRLVPTPAAKEELIAEAPDDLFLDVDTVTSLLRLAITEVTIHIIMQVACDSRSGDARQRAEALIDLLARRRISPVVSKPFCGI